MSRKHKPEEITGKLREAEIVLAKGATVGDACRRIGITERSYYRWRKEYGGLKMDPAHRVRSWSGRMRGRVRVAPFQRAASGVGLQCPARGMSSLCRLRINRGNHCAD